MAYLLVLIAKTAEQIARLVVGALGCFMNSFEVTLRDDLVGTVQLGEDFDMFGSAVSKYKDGKFDPCFNVHQITPKPRKIPDLIWNCRPFSISNRLAVQYARNFVV